MSCFLSIWFISEEYQKRYSINKVIRLIACKQCESVYPSEKVRKNRKADEEEEKKIKGNELESITYCV